jgi:hypothetical protein
MCFLSSSFWPSRLTIGTVGKGLLLVGMGLGPVVIRTGSGIGRNGTKGGGLSYRELSRHGRPSAARYIDISLEVVLVYRGPLVLQVGRGGSTGRYL